MQTGFATLGIGELREAIDRSTPVLTTTDTLDTRARTTMLTITRKMRTAAKFAFELLTGPF